jgi:hypothetical protein
LFVIKSFNVVAIGAQKQVELGVSRVLFVIKSFNVVAIGA